MSALEQISTPSVVARQSVRRHRTSGGWTARSLGEAVEDLDDEMFHLTILSNKIDRLSRRIISIGILLVGAFLGSGIIDGRAVEVIRAILGIGS